MIKIHFPWNITICFSNLWTNLEVFLCLNCFSFFINSIWIHKRSCYTPHLKCVCSKDSKHSEKITFQTFSAIYYIALANDKCFTCCALFLLLFDKSDVKTTRCTPDVEPRCHQIRHDDHSEPRRQHGSSHYRWVHVGGGNSISVWLRACATCESIGSRADLWLGIPRLH